MIDWETPPIPLSARAVTPTGITERYLGDPSFAQRFYGTQWSDSRAVHNVVERIRANEYPRNELREILIRQNSRWEMRPETATAIEQLASGAFCVITGQQVGLFGGPLYTVYKALSAISWARKLSEDLGHDVVPVFWLAGDDHDFDNTLYIAPRLQQQISILYIGAADPDDPQGMLFYLRQAFGVTSALHARVTSHRSDRALRADEVVMAHLIVATDVTGAESLATLRRHIETGGTILLVMPSAQAATMLSALTGGRVESQEADIDRYAMLGRMEFAHPVLSAFSDPRFGDFTRIHFWRHRRVDLAGLPDARVLAWYDSNDPAWFEVPIGSGALLVLTGGWHPADSDLALSSKFVPLLYSILEYGGVRMGTQAQYVVGDPVPVTGPGGPRADVRVRKPDGATVILDAGVETFTLTDVPGIYGVESAGETTWFAVNVAASEGRTDPMPLEDLERLGLSMRTPGPAAIGQVAKTTIHRGLVETESQQKLWRWVLVAASVVLLMEIWLAGRLTRPATESQGAQP